MRKIIFASLSFASLILLGCGQSVEEKANQAREARIAEANRIKERTDWIPSGFKKWGDGSKIAYRQIKANCNRFPCIDYEVVTKDGCPSLLYMKMATLDASNRNLGYTNDTTSGVDAGQISILRMELLDQNGVTGGRIAEIECY